MADDAPLAPTHGPRRPRWRRRAAAVVLVGVVVTQLYLVLGRTGDPHHRFGFQPFARADVYSAEIYRVTVDGRRLPVNDGTWEYRWSALVAEPHLTHPFRTRWASDGAEATLDLMDDALDWVAHNTPLDTTTLRLEAVVTVVPNGRDPEVTVLRSVDRLPEPEGGGS